MRLKFLAAFRSGEGITSESISDSGPFPVYGGNGLRGFTNAFTHEGKHVLIGRQGALCGNVHRVEGQFWASEHAVVATPTESTDSDWLYYLLGHLNLNQYSVSAAQPGLAVERVRELLVDVPPLPLQRRVASFLDRKTAAIDALIEKKQKLVELLAEKRAALINQAVTKGLDPTVPMKDSGIPWIGEIPAHWEVMKVKTVARFVTSGPRGWSEFYSENGPAFLRIGNVSRIGIDLLLDDVQRVSPPFSAEGTRTLAQEGDLLISITADIGSVAVVPSGLGEAYVSQHLALVRLNPVAVHNRFVAYAAKSPFGEIHFHQAMQGGTKVGLGLNDVANFPFAWAPLDEQLRIVKYVDGSVALSAKQLRALNSSITRLQEYRQALITAAVTGQLEIHEVPN